MTGTFGCCARATSGHAAAAPPSSVMNSRLPTRPVMLPSLGGMPSQTILHRYSIIHVSCTKAAIRSIGLRFQPISRFGEGLLSALIRRRDAAQAQFEASVINRIDAVQDNWRFRPRSFAEVPRSDDLMPD